MKRVLIAVAVTLVLGAGSGAELTAQPWQAGLPGNDIASLALQLGALSPASTLPDGGGFNGGFAGGITGTYWASSLVGLRGNFLQSSTSGNRAAGSRAGLEDPSVRFFGGDLALRYPMSASSMAWFPFVALGGGAKVYDWSIDSTGFDTDLTFAWNAGGGIEVRPASTPWIGLVAEARRYTSKYKWHAHHLEEPQVNDMFFTVGVSLNR